MVIRCSVLWHIWHSGKVHWCSAMGGTNACDMVLTLAVLLMSRQVHLLVQCFFFSFLFLTYGLKQGEQN